MDVTVVSLALAIVALVVAVLALRRADVVEKRARQWRLDGAPPAPVPVPEVREVPKSIAADDPSVANEAAEILRRLEALETRAVPTGDAGINRVAVVRYDAFEEVGGQLSYSVALVDAHGSGIVLTSIHGRSETRTYVKQVPVQEDSGRTASLSPEEKEALREAQRSDGHTGVTR